MERFFNRMPSTIGSSSSINNEHVLIQNQVSTSQKNIEVDIENLPSDPGLRPNIMSYQHNLIEQVRRAYLLKGPCQPREHNFPKKIDRGRKRKFVVTWFDEFKDWLEYSKRKEMLRDAHMEKVFEGIANDQIKTGKGLNQEMTLKRPGETRWSSHYGTLISLIQLFSSVLKVLEQVGEKANDYSQRGEAIDLLEIMNQFEFVFVLLLMKKILGITHELSQVLQRKDQDIVNAMNLVKVSKVHLQAMRDDGWENLLSEVSKFSSDHEIDVVNMEDHYAPRGRSRRNVEKVTNLHHYRFELFNNVIDVQAEELNRRFDEVNTELLLCMACLDPQDEFAAFDKNKVLRLATFYPSEFSTIDVYQLESQLDNFIFYIRLDGRFTGVDGIGDLAQKMVATKKHMVFPLVYLLIKLLLILPVATAIVERAFSAMKIIKSSLRNRMGDKLLNDCLVTYIEKDVFFKIPNDAIMERYQNMKNRRQML